jgi:hypothetical protein
MTVPLITLLVKRIPDIPGPVWIADRRRPRIGSLVGARKWNQLQVGAASPPPALYTGQLETRDSALPRPRPRQPSSGRRSGLRPDLGEERPQDRTPVVGGYLDHRTLSLWPPRESVPVFSPFAAGVTTNA